MIQLTKTGMASRAYSVASNITIEPILIANAIGFMAYIPVYTQLFLDATCRQVLHYDKSVCANMSAPENHDKAERVQAAWAAWNSYSLIVNSLAVMVFSVAVASWSDRYGRKLALQLPLVGATLASFLLLANFYIDNLPIWQLLVVPFLSAIGGGSIELLGASMAYISDCTSRGAERTTRFSIVFGCLMLGSSMGGFIGSFLLNHWPRDGQVATFYLFLITSLASLAYIQFVLKETVVSEASLGERVKALFSPTVFTDLWSTMTSRHGSGESGLQRFWLLLTAASVYFALMGGEQAIFQPYLELPPFNWTLPFLMLVTSCYSLGFVFTNFTVIPFIKQVLQWTDVRLSVIGIVSQLLQSAIILCTSTTTWILVAWGAGQMNLVTTVAIRALLSRVVTDAEQARAFSLYAITQNAMPTVGGLVYAQALGLSPKTWKALPFALSLVLGLVALVIVAIVYRAMKRDGALSEAAESGKGDK